MKQDRNIVFEDEKERVLDFTEYKFIPPETGIYEGDLRYYAASLEWARVLEGHISWLATVAPWTEAEDERYHAIQQILIFLRGVEMSIDYEALKAAIHDGTYDAWNDLAKQVVSGRTKNINVGEDGTVTDPSIEVIEDVEVPADDTGTADIDERKAAQYSASIAQANGFNKLLAYLNTLYGVDVAPDTSITDAIFLVKNQFMPEVGLDAAMTAYWDSRAQGVAQIVSLDREDLSNYLYCNPFRDTQDNLAAFISSLTGFTIEQKDICIDLVNGLEETQFKIWYNTGVQSYSTEYKSAPCEPIESYSFLLQFNTTFNDTRIFKANHRYEVIGEGYGQDTDGDQQDLFWHKQTGQNQVFDAADFNLQIGQAVKVKPDVFEAPYDGTNHRYKWTIDMGAINASPQWTINRDATMSVATTSPTNGFTISVKDLGLIF